MTVLEPFFNPKGVAVIGASAKPRKLGHGIVRNLIDYGYIGPIYPVNPRGGEILGLAVIPTIEGIPDPVDLAMIIVPAIDVAAALEQCGRRGIRCVTIVSGGFGETGEEGRALEMALLPIAQRHGMRIIGPNCIGTIDTHTPVNTTFVVGMPQPGDISFVSQSGAMCAVVIDWARGAGVGFSRFASLGNQVDVSEAEMLSAIAADGHTRVITAYIEGVSDGRRFMEEAQAAAWRKPVVVVKGGYSEGGAKAVVSHTGALAGTAEAYDAAFEHSGVLRASTMEELFDWARALAWQPLPQGNRVAVLTNAGGPGIMAVDALEAAGLKLAPLSETTQDYLRPRLPAVASVNNPVDILAGSGADLYAIALEALLDDPMVDMALVVMAPNDWFLPESLAEVIADASARYDKPVMASIMGLASVDKALAVLQERRVPNFAFPERAASAMAAMVARAKWLDADHEPAAPIAGVDLAGARKAIEQHDFTGALAAYGIPFPPTLPAAAAEEAIHAAEKIGYPVVLKLDSEGISHKSDAGGVLLNLANAAAVEAAYKQIVSSALEFEPGAHIRGVLVQKMMTGGLELIVGVRRDPQFGPLALVGSGGVEVELLRDVATAVAPLSHLQALRLLESTRAGFRLRGWRGAPPFDQEAVISALRRVAQIACDFPEIAELEINPLYVLPAGSGAFALDVRGGISNK